MDSGLEIVLICAVSRRRFSVTWDYILKHTLLLMQSKLKPLFVRKSDSFVRTHTCRSWGKTYIDLSNKESFKGEAGCLQPWATKTFFFFLSCQLTEGQKRESEQIWVLNNYLVWRESFSFLVLDDYSAAGKNTKQFPKIKYSVL